MGKTYIKIRTLTFGISLIFLVLVKDLNGNETDIVTHSPISVPILTRDRLSEIRLYDRKMKCFPLVLCTLSKSGAFTKLGRISLNDLADGYLRLLSAFPGGPSKDLVKDTSMRFKDDFIGSTQINNFRDSDDNNDDEEENDEENDDDDDDNNEKTKKESEEMLLSDPLLHQKEKLEMKKLMEDLMKEEKAEKTKNPSSWTSSAMSLPFQLGSTLFRGVVLPYLIGDSESSTRKRRDLDSYLNRQQSDSIQRDGKGMPIDTKQDPLGTAMTRWSKLKNPQQCSKIYKSCPFQAWEVVSMIKMIKDGLPPRQM